MVLPKVNGMDSASAQGQATISTAVKTKIAVWTSPCIIQKVKPEAAMATMIRVKYLLILSESDFRESLGFS